MNRKKKMSWIKAINGSGMLIGIPIVCPIIYLTTGKKLNEAIGIAVFFFILGMYGAWRLRTGKDSLA